MNLLFTIITIWKTILVNNVIENVTTTLQSRSIDAYKSNQDIQSVIKGVDLSYTFVEIILMKYNWNGMKNHIYYHIQIK